MAGPTGPIDAGSAPMQSPPAPADARGSGAAGAKTQAPAKQASGAPAQSVPCKISPGIAAKKEARKFDTAARANIADYVTARKAHRENDNRISAIDTAWIRIFLNKKELTREMLETLKEITGKVFTAENLAGQLQSEKARLEAQNEKPYAEEWAARHNLEGRVENELARRVGTCEIQHRKNIVKAPDATTVAWLTAKMANELGEEGKDGTLLITTIDKASVSPLVLRQLLPAEQAEVIMTYALMQPGGLKLSTVHDRLLLSYSRGYRTAEPVGQRTAIQAALRAHPKWPEIIEDTVRYTFHEIEDERKGHNDLPETISKLLLARIKDSWIFKEYPDFRQDLTKAAENFVK